MTSLHPLEHPVPSQKYQVGFVLFPLLSAQNFNDLHETKGSVHMHEPVGASLEAPRHPTSPSSEAMKERLHQNPSIIPLYHCRHLLSQPFEPFLTYLKVTEIAHVGPTAHVGVNAVDGNNANGPSMIIW